MKTEADISRSERVTPGRQGHPGRQAGIAVLLAVLAWSASLVVGDFAFDDRQAIQENPAVAGGLSVAEAFRRDYWHHVGDAGHYRPLATLSLRVDHAIHGEAAWGYHLTNVLLHAAVVGLLAFVLLRRPGSTRGTFLGLCVFAVHPVLGDSVAWISGRTSMISALGGVAALAAVAAGRRLPLILTGVTLGLLAALLGKEDGIVFVLPVLLLAVWRSRTLALACVFSVVSAVGVYLLLRAGALGTWWPSAPYAPLADTPLGERMLYAGRALLESARLVVFPFEFPPNYRAAPGFAASSPPAAWAWLGWLPWLALVALGIAAIVRARRTGRVELTWTGASCALAAVALLPTLQLLPAGVVFAPRFLYLPLLFGVPALGSLLRRIPDFLPGILLAVLLVGAWVRCGVYADSESYNRAILKHVPADAAAFNGLGLALEAKGFDDDAVVAWTTAVKRRPGYSRPWSNLGRIALAKGDLEDAARFFRHAVAAGPRNPAAHANFGAVLLRLERYAEAADAYEEATRIAPGMPAAWRGYGHALWRVGDPERALGALRRALALAPDDALTKRLMRQVRAGSR